MADASGWIGLMRSIKNMQTQNQEKDARDAKAAFELGEKEKWLRKSNIINLEFETDPVNVYARKEAEIGGEVIGETLAAQEGLPELKGKNLGEQAGWKEISQKNAIYYNNNRKMPGSNMTYGEYYIKTDALNAYNKIQEENNLNMPFLEKERLNGDAAQALGLPRNTPPAEVMKYKNRLDTILGIEKNQILYTTPITQGGGTDKQIDQFYTTQDEERKSNEALVLNLRELKNANPNWTPSPLNAYDNNERATLIRDATAVASGNVNRIYFSETQTEMMNEINGEIGLPLINPDLDYITFDTLKSKDLKNKAEVINGTREVINQYTALPHAVYKTLPVAVQRRITSNIAGASSLLYKQLQEVTTTDGKAVLMEGRKVNLGDVGLFLQSMPQYVRDAVKTNIQDGSAPVYAQNSSEGEPPRNNVLVENEEDNTLEYKSANLNKELIENIFPVSMTLGQGKGDRGGVSPDAALFHIIRSHAIANNRSMSEYDGNESLIGQAIAQAPSYRRRAQASYSLADVLFEKGVNNYPTFKLHKSILNTREHEIGVGKASVVAYLASNKGSAAMIGGLKMDPYTYYKTQADLVKENLNLDILKNDPSFLSHKRLMVGEDETRGGGTQKTFKFNQKNYVEALGIDKEEATAALSFATPAYQAGVALLENFMRTDVGGSGIAGLVQFIDNLKNLPKSAYSGFSEYAINKTGGSFSFSGILDGIGNTIALMGDDVDRDVDAEGNVQMRSVSLHSVLTDAKQNLSQSFTDINEQEFKDLLNAAMTTQQPTKAQLFAQQKMLHAALVFYTAAAFQGEGGKAISDGDRKFVEWALSYGVLTNVDQRRHAIAGMLKIIGKARVVNEYMASADPRDNYVGKNFNRIYGDSVITGNEVPTELLVAYSHLYGDPKNIELVQMGKIGTGILKKSQEVSKQKVGENRVSLGTVTPADITRSDPLSTEVKTNIAVPKPIEPTVVNYAVKDGGMNFLKPDASEATVNAALRAVKDNAGADNIITNFPHYELKNPFENKANSPILQPSAE